jgi:fibronectin type 3 domain-containing protein
MPRSASAACDMLSRFVETNCRPFAALVFVRPKSSFWGRAQRPKHTEGDLPRMSASAQRKRGIMISSKRGAYVGLFLSVATWTLGGCARKDAEPSGVTETAAALQSAPASTASGSRTNAKSRQYAQRSQSRESGRISASSTRNGQSATGVQGCQPSRLSLGGGTPLDGFGGVNPVKIVPIMWGDASGFGFKTSDEDSFVNNLVSSNWYSWMVTEYHAPTVVAVPTITLGNPNDPTPVPPLLSQSNAGKVVVTDTDIQYEITSHLRAGDGAFPLDANGTVNGMLYVIHFPTSVSVQFGGDNTNLLCGGADGTHLGSIVTDWACAYNKSGPGFEWNGNVVHYAVMPDQTGLGCQQGDAAKDSFCHYQHAPTPLDDNMVTESHEIGEAMTDPHYFDSSNNYVQGWVDVGDGNCGQIGDICNGEPTTTTGAKGTISVQMMWSNSAGRCEGDSPGAPADVENYGTSAIILTGDTDPGTTTTMVHIAESGTPGQLASTALAAEDLAVDSTWMTNEKAGKPVVGDFNGDGWADIALTGVSATSIPTALSSNFGSRFTILNGGMTTTSPPPELASIIGQNVAALAQQTTFPPVVGDFNGDGYSDFAFVGGSGWNMIPVAFSAHNATGDFWGTAETDSGFNTYISNSANVPQLVSADFNGDGLTDLALVGITQTANVGWPFIAIAFAQNALETYGPTTTFPYGRGTGEWLVRSVNTDPPAGGAATDFNSFASLQNVKAVGGDFDGDGFGDIALAGGTNWSSVVIAYARPASGFLNNFQVVNAGGGGNASFAAQAATVGTQVVAGDFDGNGFWDLAVAGGGGWNFVGLALSPAGQKPLGTMLWDSAIPSLPTFTQQASQMNVLASSASRGGPFGMVAPPPPTGLAAASRSAQVTLSWTASAGAMSYNVFRGLSPGGEATTAIASVATNTYTDTGLTNGTTYYYKVNAVGAMGTSAMSSEMVGRPVAIPPAPTNLAGTAGNAQVSLTWTASAGAATYNLYRGTTAGGESTTAVATGITGTSYTNTGLANGTKYYFKVAAVNGSGTSPMSNEASATPVGAPPAPTNLAATAGNAQVSLTWTASAGAATYNLYRGTTAGGESATAVATGITATSYTNTGLANGTKYYFKVAAVGSGGTSPQSNEANATPVAPPPAPTNLAATAGSAQVSLTWTASSGATSYNVYRGTAAGGESGTPIATGVTTTSYTNTGLSNGTKYYFKVAAVNAGGTSGMSNESSATPVASSSTQMDCGITTGPPSGWVVDAGTGGSLKNWIGTSVNTSLLSGTIPPQSVLQTGRVGGTLTYTFSGLVANSSHTVTMYFVENYWTAAGSRLFSVSANGTQKVPTLDVFASAGNNRYWAIQRSFTATADSGGHIALTLTASKDNATVEGIIVQ